MGLLLRDSSFVNRGVSCGNPLGTETRWLCVDASLWRLRLALVVGPGLSCCPDALTVIDRYKGCALSRTVDDLVGSVAQLLERQGWSQVDAVAVTNGPGSFTGVRMALAAVQGLSIAWPDLHIMVSNSLHALAATDCHHYRHGPLEECCPRLVLADSGAGDVYAAWYGARWLRPNLPARGVWRVGRQDAQQLVVGASAPWRVVWSALPHVDYPGANTGNPRPHAVYHAADPAILPWVARPVSWQKASRPVQLSRVRWSALEIPFDS